MKRFYLSARAKLGLALGSASLVSMGLYFAGSNGNYAYLPWNLLLAWVALVAALWLERILQHALWSGWYALVVTMVWLVFLPNTFYMISDFVHIREVSDVDLLYVAVLFSSFIFNGVLLGYLSLIMVHWQLLRRMSAKSASIIIGLVLLLCSFAIYIGRELRWSTWDIVANPSSLLFDVSDRILKPHEHPQTFVTTASFFVLLSMLYVVLWFVIRVGRQQRD